MVEHLRAYCTVLDTGRRVGEPVKLSFTHPTEGPAFAFTPLSVDGSRGSWHAQNFVAVCEDLLPGDIAEASLVRGEQGWLVDDIDTIKPAEGTAAPFHRH